MAKCRLEQRVCSEARGYVGNWVYTLEIDLPRVPVAGDDICWDPDWASCPVKMVTLSPGTAVVDLMPVRTDNPETIKEMDRMPGWEKHGGPWAGQ